VTARAVSLVQERSHTRPLRPQGDEEDDMGTTPAPPGTPITRSRRGQHQAGPKAAGLAGLVLVAAACLGCSAGHGTAGTGSGSGGGQTFIGGGTSSQGKSTAGGYTRAFARCMRAHGVSKFPDPGGPSGRAAGLTRARPSSKPRSTGHAGPLHRTPGWPRDRSAARRAAGS